MGSHQSYRRFAWWISVVCPELLYVCRGDVGFVGLVLPYQQFKEGIVKAFFGGFAHKLASKRGTVKADVCERFIAGYRSPNFCDLIAGSLFPDSDSKAVRG